MSGGRREVLQVAVAQGAMGFAVTSLGAVLVLLARDLGVAPARLAWLASAFGAGLLLAAAAGPVLLRRDPQRTLRAGALGLAAGAALLALATTRPLATAGALLVGVGGAGLVLVTPVLLAGAQAAQRLAKVNAASSAAGVAAPLALGGLDGAAGQGRLVLLAAVPPLVLLALSARPRPGGLPGAVPSAAPDGPRPGRRTVGARWLRVALAVAVEFCFAVWAVTRLQATGLGPAAAAAWGSAFPLGMAVGRLAGPRLIGRVPVVPLAAAVSAAGAVGVALAGATAPVAASLALAGLGVAVLYPVTLADLTHVPGLRAAHAASFGALASGVAILAAPPALAALGEAVDLRLAFLACLPLLAVLVALPPGGVRRGVRPAWPRRPRARRGRRPVAHPG